MHDRRPADEDLLNRLLLIVGILISIRVVGTTGAPAGNRTDRVATISSVCLLNGPRFETPEYVVEQVTRACQRPGSDLVVAPFTPFLRFAETTQEGGLALFSDLARSNLSVALLENSGSDTYATSLLFDRQGRIVFKWRKTHALADDDHLKLGDQLEVYRTDFGVIG